MRNHEQPASGREGPEPMGAGLDGVDALAQIALTSDPDGGGRPGGGMTRISPFVPGAPYGLEHMPRRGDGSGETVRVSAAPLPHKVPHPDSVR